MALLSFPLMASFSISFFPGFSSSQSCEFVFVFMISMFMFVFVLGFVFVFVILDRKMINLRFVCL